MSPPVEGSCLVSAVRLDGPAADEETCALIREDILTIRVEGAGTYSLMWTPTGPVGEAQAFFHGEGTLGEGPLSESLCLAAGFLFTEGVIDGLDDLKAMAFCPDDSRVVVAYLQDPDRPRPRRRDALIASSCALCGEGGGIEGIIDALPIVSGDLVMEATDLTRMMGEMRRRQHVFEATGGAHAAAVFDSAGRIVAMAEDLGRHNALDKVIGRCLLEGLDAPACGVLLSSRLSLEMVAKSARAGFQLVAAVSAPTSLAVEVAQRKGITLCGFIREERCTVYSHGRRVAVLGAESAWVN